MTTAPIVSTTIDPVIPPVVPPPLTPPVVPPVVADPKGPQTPEELAAEVEKWKSMARKHEDASKSKDDRLKRLDEIEESQKTESQRLIERAEKAEAHAKEIEVRATRAEVAAAKGVPVSLVTGTTKEEMESAADALIAFRGTPLKPDMGGGARGGDVGDKKVQITSLEGMTSAQIVQAKKDGLLNDLLEGKK